MMSMGRYIFVNTLLLFFWSGWLAPGCSPLGPNGSLLVKSASEGQYEVYKVDSEFPFQFTSETIGTFNKELSLAAGQYLILADCSSKTLVIRPHKKQTLVTHNIHFEPPAKPGPNDKFSIQCDRYSQTQSRQSHMGQFVFNVLAGKRDLLVGMVPFKLNGPKMLDEKTPHKINYKLSSIQVESFPNMKPGTRYFVSPENALIAVTAQQRFGHKQFLLPGVYTIEVNGTKSRNLLKAGEETIISPAFLTILAHKKADLSLSSHIRGEPLYAELNDTHHIDINETYPVMPGQAKIRLSHSSEYQKVKLVENQLAEVKVRSVIVHSDCSPWDWTCIGRTSVFLFSKDKPYPTVKGVMDVPLLFFTKDAWVSLLGTRDIKRKIPDDLWHSSFYVGKAVFKPQPVYRKQKLTDLARIETSNEESKGQSLDLNLKVKESQHLITGTYQLGQYATIQVGEGTRERKVKNFRIRRNRVTNVPFSVYHTEPNKSKAAIPKSTQTQARRGSDYQMITGEMF